MNGADDGGETMREMKDESCKLDGAIREQQACRIENKKNEAANRI
jgi:hypothetical protein